MFQAWEAREQAREPLRDRHSASMSTGLWRGVAETCLSPAVTVLAAPRSLGCGGAVERSQCHDARCTLVPPPPPFPLPPCSHQAGPGTLVNTNDVRIILKHLQHPPAAIHGIQSLCNTVYSSLVCPSFAFSTSSSAGLAASIFSYPVT